MTTENESKTTLPTFTVLERAVLYARVSTDLQRDNYSIPTQLAACVRHAESRGLAIVGDRFVNPTNGLDVASGGLAAYVDDYSSRELSRPALDAAIKFLDSYGFDVLMVYSLDRLARDPYIRQTLEREIIARGARIEYVTGGYDESPEGEVRKDMDATFAKWENAKRVERCNRGKLAKAGGGKFVAGRAPYGYEVDRRAFGGLAVVHSEARIVERIFQMYVIEGFSIRKIAKALNEESIKPPTREKWGKSSIQKLLRDTAYVGHVFYNKFKRNGKKLIQRDRQEWIKINVPPIVDEVLFFQAQEMMDFNREYRRKQPTRFYLLSGMVFCADCEKAYSPQATRKGEYLSYRHRAKEGHCQNKHINAAELEGSVWEKIEGLLRDPKNVLKAYEEMLAEEAQKHERKRSVLESMRHRFERLARQKQKLIEAYTDPDLGMSKGDFMEQKGRIDTEQKVLSAEIVNLETELQADLLPLSLGDAQEFFARVSRILDNQEIVTDQVKRQVFEVLRMRVMIGTDGRRWIEGGDKVLLSPTC
ncbi:MAG: recombinase family protein [Anaerolineales bacterium]|nr:recombinase family protein [Anaerolineales bacterium]